MTIMQPADYKTLDLELFTVRDLTDALEVDVAAKILNTSRRAIYTIRCTNSISERRAMRLIAAIRENEEFYRSSLVIKRNNQKTRAERRTD